MAEQTCAQCGKKFEMCWVGARRCTKCGLWLCPQHGSGKSVCPKCNRSTLK